MRSRGSAEKSELRVEERELRFRGFAAIFQPPPSMGEVPVRAEGALAEVAPTVLPHTPAALRPSIL